MEIHIPVHELKPMMAGLARVVVRNPSLPIFGIVKVTQDASGVAHIEAVAPDTFLTGRLYGTRGDACEVLVPFDVLQRAIKGCRPTDEITVGIQDGQLLIGHELAGKPVRQAHEALALQEWPTLPTIDATIETLDDSFKQAVANSFECCSEDETRTAIGGAWIDVTDDKSHYVMGTDGQHLYAANSFNLGLKESLLLPHHRFLAWPAFHRDGPWKLAVQPVTKQGYIGWIRLRSDQWSLIIKRPDHNIPNWRQVVPRFRDLNSKVIFSPPSMEFLEELLPRLPGFNDPKQPVRFDLSKGKLTVTARERNADDSTTIDVGDVTVTGPSMSITVNRSFVAKALKFGLTVMEMSDELSPVLFSGPGRRLVAMPLRTDSAPNPAPAPAPASPEEPDQSSQQPADTEGSEDPTEPNEPAATSTHQPHEEPMRRIATSIPAEPTPEHQPTNGDNQADLKPTVRSIIEQIDGLKESLKSVVRQFGDITDALRLVEKEKKANDREVEQIREKFRAIKNVTL